MKNEECEGLVVLKKKGLKLWRKSAFRYSSSFYIAEFYLDSCFRKKEKNIAITQMLNWSLCQSLFSP
ncbi:MAG: hypothetical protein PHE75_07710, partial [Candidatus Cloacimonas acidaminovorans]|nr:hypothetical protein [Candidatus Cloacimonas acidaminovorans]